MPQAALPREEAKAATPVVPGGYGAQVGRPKGMQTEYCLIFGHPVVAEDGQVEEVDYSVFVDIASRDCSQVGVGLVFSYVPYVYEVPAIIGKGALHLHLGCGSANGTGASRTSAPSRLN